MPFTKNHFRVPGQFVAKGCCYIQFFGSSPLCCCPCVDTIDMIMPLIGLHKPALFQFKLVQAVCELSDFACEAGLGVGNRVSGIRRRRLGGVLARSRGISGIGYWGIRILGRLQKEACPTEAACPRPQLQGVGILGYDPQNSQSGHCHPERPRNEGSRRRHGRQMNLTYTGRPFDRLRVTAGPA